MRKHTLLTLLMLLILGIGQSYAQYEDFENDRGSQSGNGGNRGSGDQRLIDRLRFGGSFGLGFNGGIFAANVDPCVGYAFNKYVTAGVTSTLEYYHHSDPYFGDPYSQFIIGGGLYAEAYPIEFLVAHIEAQSISYQDYGIPSGPERRSDGVILLGGGYRRPVSERSAINMMLLWNLNATQGIIHNTSFSNPIIRISFIF